MKITISSPTDFYIQPETILEKQLLRDWSGMDIKINSWVIDVNSSTVTSMCLGFREKEPENEIKEALKAYINDHGPITNDLIENTTKSILEAIEKTGK